MRQRQSNRLRSQQHHTPLTARNGPQHYYYYYYLPRSACFFGLERQACPPCCAIVLTLIGHHVDIPSRYLQPGTWRVFPFQHRGTFPRRSRPMTARVIAAGLFVCFRVPRMHDQSAIVLSYLHVVVSLCGAAHAAEAVWLNRGHVGCPVSERGMGWNGRMEEWCSVTLDSYHHIP